jgi:hypothetical protein
VTPLPSPFPKTREQLQEERRAAQQAQRQAAAQTINACTDGIKGLRLSIMADKMQKNLDASQGLSAKDRADFEADIQAARDAAAKGLDAAAPVDPCQPQQGFDASDAARATRIDNGIFNPGHGENAGVREAVVPGGAAPVSSNKPVAGTLPGNRRHSYKTHTNAVLTKASARNCKFRKKHSTFIPTQASEGETMKRIIFCVVWILATCVFCSAQNTLYFPQVVDGFSTDGSGWVTAIAITNTAAPGSASASGSITLTQDNGTPWNVSFADEQNQPVANGSTISFQMSGGQSRAYVSRANQFLTAGFATITSTAPLTAAVVFIEFANFGNTRIAEAGVPASSALLKQGSFVTKITGQNTGIAVANPGVGSVSVTFQVLGTNGAAVLPAVSRTVAARGHTAFFISELFPGLPDGFFGTVQVTSSTAVVTTALVFEPTGQFATLPIFPLP